jgi:hypothetical protein
MGSSPLTQKIIHKISLELGFSITTLSTHVWWLLQRLQIFIHRILDHTNLLTYIHEIRYPSSKIKEVDMKPI